MRKLLSLAAVLLVAAKVMAATVHVPGDYPSVYEALGHVVSGDIIKIAEVNYTEPQRWDNLVAGVIVEGSGWWCTILCFEDHVGIEVNQPGCVFRNFQIWGRAVANLVDIYAPGAVFDRMVLRPTASGVYVDVGANPTLSNLVIDGGSNPLSTELLLAEPETQAVIYNCLLMNAHQGIRNNLPHRYMAFWNVTEPYAAGTIPDPTDLPLLTANPLTADYTTIPGAPIIDAGDPDVIDSYDGTVSDIGCGYAQRVCKIGWTPEIDRVPTPGDPTEEVFCPEKQFTLYYQDLKANYPPLNGAATVQKFVVLDVYGGYYFWPDWTTETGWVDRPIFDGYDQSGTILDFTWPQFDGEAHGLAIWAALWNPTDPQPPMISGLQFGYTSECP